MKIPSSQNYIEDDILLVHKPVGISSFGLVAQMRRVLGTRKIGHAGTLDPLASGLMILGVNKGTKKMKSYVGLDKVYIAEILIGRSTTTGDKEGDIVESKQPEKSDMKQADLESALEGLYGERYFPAPLYSAVKVLGKPLYKYARSGETPPYIPEKKMHIKRAYITDVYKQIDGCYIVRARLNVGSGTYVRTIAEEFGKSIGYPASLKSLYRLSVGDYLDKDAFRLQDKKSLFHDILERYSIIKKRICRYFFNQKK